MTNDRIFSGQHLLVLLVSTAWTLANAFAPLPLPQRRAGSLDDSCSCSQWHGAPRGPVVVCFEQKAAQGSNNDNTVATSNVAETAVPPVDWKQLAAQYPLDTNDNDKAVVSSRSSSLRHRVRGITAIASDVDGTLLSSAHDFHPLTQDAIQAAVDAAESPEQALRLFFPATGKSRAGALASLGPVVGPLLAQKCPGVFLQGLYCVDETGAVVFQAKLGAAGVEMMEEVAHECGVAIFAYDGDVIFTTERTAETHPDMVAEFHDVWGEPRAVVLSTFAGYEGGFNKCLVMNSNTTHITNVVRPRMEDVATACDATVTQGFETMLELLPPGCSKAMGVQKLCEHYGIDMGTELLAMGDAENDREMLQRAAIGVAMGNACPEAQSAADLVLTETNDQGAAGIAIQLFGLGKALQ